MDRPVLSLLLFVGAAGVACCGVWRARTPAAQAYSQSHVVMRAVAVIALLASLSTLVAILTTLRQGP